MPRFLMVLSQKIIVTVGRNTVVIFVSLLGDRDLNGAVSKQNKTVNNLNITDTCKYVLYLSYGI